MHKRLNHLLSMTLILLVPALLCPGSAFAQQADDAEVPVEPASTEDTSGEGEVDESQDDNAGTEPSSEVFLPTEEISEDFAVSFPVDI